MVPGKAVGEPCMCKLKCFEKLTPAEQIHIMNKFRSFSTKNEQDIYLQGLLVSNNIKNRRPRKEEAKQRSSSFEYFVLVNTERRKVCKKAFLSLHGISSKLVQRLQLLLNLGKSPRDLRGLQNNRKTVPGNIIQIVCEHISTFPVKHSHYASKEYLYLDAKLNVKKLHSLFKEKHTEIDVKYSTYYKIFKEHFDYKFGRPQVDTCCQCEELEIKSTSSSLNETAKRAALAELMVHKRRSKKFNTSIQNTEKMCKENDRVLGLCFDYMQNISLPSIPVQDIFYLRQLSLFPFGIHNLKNGSAQFFLYHEGLAKKGPNETCSFLFKYIKQNVPASVKELHLYSDGSGGQNKNNVMTRFCLAVTDSGMFEKVVHKFPIRGHSFLPCDRDFGLVKRKLNRIDRLYTPMEVCEVICNAAKGQKFTVEMVDTDDVLNFKNWWSKYYKKTCFSLESSARSIPRSKKESFAVSTFMEFRYNHERKGTVEALKYIDGVQKSSFLLKIPDAGIVQLANERAYPGEKIPINIKKINDIRKVTGYIPENFMDFYEKILGWPTTDAEAEHE
ncbi:uncharacterized protein LOC126748889 [Anthonomus grandis grandis]|uniref:uncharacterized protein LOC126748889 n=1 Tax=Anthonomus grandis grandis TaxID=2921223 RepID=UPI002166AEAB|nr:uncharacterized protein LOC126748889 [Anthonomus grandis grandis]